MKWFGIVLLISLGLILSGCGGGENSRGSINGNWVATLTNSDGSTAFAFSTTFTQIASNGLTPGSPLRRWQSAAYADPPRAADEGRNEEYVLRSRRRLRAACGP